MQQKASASLQVHPGTPPTEVILGGEQALYFHIGESIAATTGNQRATKASACTCKWPQRVPHHIQKEGEKENESMTICKYHTHSHTLTYAYLYVYIYIYMFACVHIYTYIYIYIVFIYLFVYLFISKRT